MHKKGQNEFQKEEKREIFLKKKKIKKFPEPEILFRLNGITECKTEYMIITLRHITVKFKNLKDKENYTILSTKKWQPTHRRKTVRQKWGINGNPRCKKTG